MSDEKIARPEKVPAVDSRPMVLIAETDRANPIDRYSGCLLGLACGDALGTTLEFKPPGTFERITDMCGGGPFGLEPGQWTDDTSMALCLAESLIQRGSLDPQDQMERYVRWFREGHLSSTGECFDIGTTTKKALYEFLTSKVPFAGSTAENAAGNGSIMRLGPVPMAYATKPARAIQACGDSSRTTHGAQTCVDACRYLGALMVGAIRGASKEELLADHYSPVPDYWRANQLHPKIDEIAGGSFKQKEPPEIRGTGYVVESLEAALWAFYKTDSFADGCLLAVNLGDDADTTGAVYGQLAGAYYGEEGIPSEWCDRLAMKDTIRSFADGLRKVAAEIRYDGL